MAKGAVGVNTGMIIRLKKPDSIKCDCSLCTHSKISAGVLYCRYYDIISPKKKKCMRYIKVKSRKPKKAKPAELTYKRKASNKKTGSKFYAIKNGRRSNIILTSWDECKKMTNGVSNAKFKSFNSREQAEKYLQS